MTLSILVYGLVLGGLLSASTHLLDGALRTFRRPTRWLWVLAMAGTALAPFLVILLPGRGPATPASGTLIPLETLYGLWEGVGGWDEPTVSLFGVLEGPLTLAWATASLLVFTIFVVATAGLRRRAAGWTAANAAGEDVLVSDGLGPAVLGLLNPRIVLPPWALSLGREELAMVLLHENEHRRARDPALLAVGILLTAMTPWNPALWWQLQRLRLAVEGDCDGRVLARGVPPRRYGSLLLGVAAEAQGFFPLASALSERGGAYLERRLQMMKQHGGKRRTATAAGAVVVGGLCLALACETPTPPQAQAPTEAEGILVERAEDGTGAQASFMARETDPGAATGKAEARFMIRETEGQSSDDGPVAGILLRTTEGSGDPGTAPLVYIDEELQGDGMEAVRGLNPDQIDRIEVVKGPAAQAVFGEEAVGGVIQIFLKK